MEYQGTLLLVSHDRDFIDQVVSSTLVYEGDGFFREYVGGYSDYIQQSKSQVSSAKAIKKDDKNKATKKVKALEPELTKPKKRSYKEQRELEQLPLKIESLESQLESLQQEMSAPDFYRQSPDAITTCHETLAQVQADLNQAYERWEALESWIEPRLPLRYRI